MLGGYCRAGSCPAKSQAAAGGAVGYLPKTRVFFWVLLTHAVRIRRMGQNEPQKPGNESTAPDSIRCVLWVDPGCPEPSALVEGLTRRGVRVHTVCDAASVMVELAGAATDLLVIDQTQRRLDTSRLTAAVGRYFPAVICRKYITCPASGRQQLVDLADAPVHDDDLDDPEQSAGVPAASDSHVGEQAADDNGQAHRPLVTQQEMTMLIGEVPIDATLDRHGASQASE